MPDTGLQFGEDSQKKAVEGKRFLDTGRDLLEQGLFSEAVESFRLLIECQPLSADGYHYLGRAQSALGRYRQALQSQQFACWLDPQHFQAFLETGSGLIFARQLEKAEAALRRAVELEPSSAAALRQLGLALLEQERLDEAASFLDAAGRLNPNDAEAQLFRGLNLHLQGRFSEALEAYAFTLSIDTDHAQARLFRSWVEISLGRFEKGWQGFESRRECDWYDSPHLPGTPWTGQDVGGRAVLLYAEQGIGDTIQYVRYASLLEQNGAQVFVRCPARLIPLLSSTVPAERLVATGSPLPSFDFHAPLPSMPALCGTTLQTIPAGRPYLHAERERLARWREWFGGTSDLKVGLVWQGNPAFRLDHHRSLPLKKLASILKLPGVRFYSLQRGFGVEQLDHLPDDLSLERLPAELDSDGAFLDSAAVMKCLDLVITVDTAAAHVAGALGVRTALMLQRAPHHTWLLERTDSPWYPSLRLYRQQRCGDWEPVIQEIRSALLCRPDTKQRP